MAFLTWNGLSCHFTEPNYRVAAVTSWKQDNEFSRDELVQIFQEEGRGHGHRFHQDLYGNLWVTYSCVCRAMMQIFASLLFHSLSGRHELPATGGILGFWLSAWRGGNVSSGLSGLGQLDWGLAGITKGSVKNALHSIRCSAALQVASISTW